MKRTDSDIDEVFFLWDSHGKGPCGSLFCHVRWQVIITGRWKFGRHMGRLKLLIVGLITVFVLRWYFVRFHGKLVSTACSYGLCFTRLSASCFCCTHLQNLPLSPSCFARNAVKNSWRAFERHQISWKDQWQKWLQKNLNCLRGSCSEESYEKHHNSWEEGNFAPFIPELQQRFENVHNWILSPCKMLQCSNIHNMMIRKRKLASGIQTKLQIIVTLCA